LQGTGVQKLLLWKSDHVGKVGLRQILYLWLRMLWHFVLLSTSYSCNVQ